MCAAIDTSTPATNQPQRAVRALVAELVVVTALRGAGFGSVVGCPELVGVAGGEVAPVHVDLVVDELEVLLQLGELREHFGAMVLQEVEPFLLVARPGGDELGVAPDGLDGHAGGPQL